MSSLLILKEKEKMWVKVKEKKQELKK